MPRALAAALLFASLASAGRARAAGALDPAATDWEGLGDFALLASAELPGRVVATNRLEYERLDRKDGVLLVHPEGALDTGSLARFMRDGGRVVLADDFGDGDALLAHFGIDRVPLPAKPALALRHNPALPIAEPASEHSVVWGVSRVVLNHASGLRHPELSPVLKVRGEDEDVLVAVAGAVGKGRLLAIGDASVLMNSMLRFPGNRALAAGIAHYAVEDDAGGPRGGRLFVVSGRLEQVGTYGEAPGALGALESRAQALRDALSTLGREGLPPWAMFAFAILGGLGLMWWTGVRAGRVHSPVAPRFVRPIPLAAQGGVAGHAAVLVAPGTSRVLAMLEVKNALEDELCEACALERNPGHEALLAELDTRRALDAADRSVLRSLMLRLSRVETYILSRRGAALGRVRDDDVVAASRTARRIVERVRARLG